MRQDGRLGDQMRPVRIIPHFTKNAAGSVLVEFGETRVICTVCCESGVPNFLRNSHPAQGWLTAEYGMLPGSTNTRSRRERPQTSGRSQEIQRLIGRSLRGIVDLKKIPDMTLTVDCDVLQADGGTRTAAITGGFVALKLALNGLMASGRIKENPILDAVAAVSVGILKDEALVDLNYEEDKSADVDMNIVMTQSGKLLEVQGTAEGLPFSREDVNRMLEMAEFSLNPIFDLQLAAAEGREVES